MWCGDRRRGVERHALLHDDFLAGLQSIPKELYEAARARRRLRRCTEFWHVTDPGAAGDLPVTVMLSTVFTSTSIVVVNILTNGAPAEPHATSCRTASYGVAMGTGRLGVGSAVNMIFFPLLVLFIVGLTGACWRADGT